MCIYPTHTVLTTVMLKYSYFPVQNDKATVTTHTRLLALFEEYLGKPVPERYKKLSYRRVTVRCVLSVVILPITTQQCRNYLYDKS